MGARTAFSEEDGRSVYGNVLSPESGEQTRWKLRSYELQIATEDWPDANQVREFEAATFLSFRAAAAAIPADAMEKELMPSRPKIRGEPSASSAQYILRGQRACRTYRSGSGGDASFRILRSEPVLPVAQQSAANSRSPAPECSDRLWQVPAADDRSARPLRTSSGVNGRPISRKASRIAAFCFLLRLSTFLRMHSRLNF